MGSPGMHSAEDRRAGPYGMQSMSFSEEGSASVQSPQPADRAWQTGQWVSFVTDQPAFQYVRHKSWRSLSCSSQQNAYAQFGARDTIAESTGPA